ncbi:MAG: M16 family metallopeptidase [Hyphomicrobiaceae bacterium]
MKIQEVKSPGGISAWLVESHNVPLMALRFAFEGGSAQDPAGKDGTANFLTAMLDEGAGDLDSAAFQERMEEIAMRLGFQDGRDHLYGSFETLTIHREKAVELLRLAVTRPRFDPDAVERIKKQISANIAFSDRDPERVASKEWSKLAFPNHPYGRPPSGTLATVEKIGSADLKAFHNRVFARDNLMVVAVGDIDAATLGKLLDDVFGALPAKSELTPIPSVKLHSPATEVIEMPMPQSVARFGNGAMLRNDPDFIPAYVVNQILGGGGFASRLMEEVREKRGLAYSVYSYLSPMEKAGAFVGGVATKNSELKQSLDVIKAELNRMATEGPTQTELDNAKSYLIGSYALRFDTNSKIADQLLGTMVQGLGIDYFHKRNELIKAVTLADAKRVAARFLKVDELVITVVGKPEGLKSMAVESKEKPKVKTPG